MDVIAPPVLGTNYGVLAGPFRRRLPMEDAMNAITLGSALPIIGSGLVATAALTAFALSFLKLGLLQMNPVEAVGSVVSGERRTAYPAGALLHFAMGIFFAFIYTALLQLTGTNETAEVVFRSTGIALVHGFVVSFLLVIFVGEHNQWLDFRQEGMGLAPIYLVAHVIYGLTLGIMLAAFGILS